MTNCWRELCQKNGNNSGVRLKIQLNGSEDSEGRWDCLKDGFIELGMEELKVRNGIWLNCSILLFLSMHANRQQVEGKLHWINYPLLVHLRNQRLVRMLSD